MMSDNVTLEISLAEAEHMLGLKHVISKDTTRPVLMHIQFTVVDGDLLVVGTDSYRLGLITFRENGDKRVRDIPKDLPLPFAQFEAFVKSALTAARASGMTTRHMWHERVILRIEADMDRYTASFEVPILSMTQAAKVGDFSYPKWKALIPDDLSLSLQNDSMLPSFSTRYLMEMHRFIEPVAGMKTGDLPIQLMAGTHQSELKPWLFMWNQASTGIEKQYLLMPVRTNRD